MSGKKGAYPTQSSGAAGYPAQLPAQPPPYSAAAPTGPPPNVPPPYGYPVGQPYPMPAAQPYYQYQTYPAGMQYVQNPSTVIVHGGYDAGARFDGAARPNIPPPPPGCIPNPAQMAAAQGCNVVMTQRPNDVFMGGSDGGYTWF